MPLKGNKNDAASKQDLPTTEPSPRAPQAALYAAVRFHLIAAGPARRPSQLGLAPTSTDSSDERMRAGRPLAQNSIRNSSTTARLVPASPSALVQLRSGNCSKRYITLAQCDGTRIAWDALNAEQRPPILRSTWIKARHAQWTQGVQRKASLRELKGAYLQAWDGMATRELP